MYFVEPSQYQRITEYEAYLRQIENWIVLLLDAPLPEVGKSGLALQLLPSIHSAITFALPDPTRLSLIDFPLHLPLELLGVNQCLKVLSCILLEKKVLVISRDYNALTMSVLALVSMIYPLEYMFPVIPLLPCLMPSSEQILLAPTPFVIGIPASFVLLKKINLPSDVWVIDLDANEIHKPGNEPEVPRLPEFAGQQLKTHLYQALKAMGAEETFQNNVQNTDEKLTESYIYGNDVDAVDVATRVAMIRFFDSPGVLRGFNKHMRTLRLYPRPVVAFQSDCFLQSVSKASEKEESDEFLRQLSKSQAVEYMGEWCLSPSNVAFIRIQNGIWDPSLIGDKPKWFAQHLEQIHFNISGGDLEQLLSNSDLIESDEIPHWPKLLLDKVDQDQVSMVAPRPGDLLLTRKRAPMSRGSSVSIPKSFSNSSGLSVASSQKSNSSPLMATATGPTQDARAAQMARIVAKQRKRAEINNDAELIRECAREAVDGSGVSWMKLRRVKKLMENESWRLYILSRLNQSTQREDNTEYVEAVEISPKAFKGSSSATFPNSY